ncbi:MULTISPECIES: VOC family protein [Bacillus cereus group]|uniref:Glyoxalase/bleomycin resistance/extradiol dioxygenase family protein n=1 Tax=Bacillus cereus TaxID=1396 RepID=A0AA44TEP9_BACCE|nr:MULTISPECIES: VOC family protein [Bacillus cereus group]PFA17695.1 glyoxalase/bleomycin resistance/extradiol dioxygenase family protein [Bacillus cereus]PFN01975.1 glyoxalase/bleomycin resistance/extradiol dioxygenase family protein [Bacillus cereus]PFO78078.1 glyoxalase/bleomycin resistance/extradiol dioxygenase family protein [Bacillus cereus]PFS01262.1 glyoxalase/bleomycin resistance/extradiol dioxygenase family protein [Bacillus cereus]PGZ16225.1 glyoxalase/bleomycin resistance/extradio
MIHKVGQIMLYVNNQDEAVQFWTEKVGFHLVADESNGQGFRWIEIAPTEEAETSIVLHNKELIAKMQPELNLSTPSMLFFTEDIEKLYKDFAEKEITVGELVNMPTGRAFNFADYEGNYFAIMEKK